MFALNSNTSANNLPTHPTQSLNHQFSQLVSAHQSPNYSFFNFPSHFLDDDDLFLDTILPYQSPPPPALPPPPTTTIDTHNGENSGEPTMVAVKEKGRGKRKRAGTLGQPVRRAGKKDRHSKINTAHGPRDRRMRLSLQIARKFFDLQDMLGFDKASKTIEWLFNKSKSAIKDLAERSCTSIFPCSPSHDGNNGGIINDENDKQRKSKGGLFQKKENREKARARARERTKEKLIMMQKQGSKANPSCSENNNMQVHEYGFCHNQEQQAALEEQMASVGIIDKFLTTSSSSSLFDFDHNVDHQDRATLNRSVVIRFDDAIGFDDFPGSWMTAGNERISAAGFEAISSNMDSSSANCAFMGSSFN